MKIPIIIKEINQTGFYSSFTIDYNIIHVILISGAPKRGFSNYKKNNIAYLQAKIVVSVTE